MESTQKILRLAVAFCLVVLSLSTFIFSIRDNSAMAATPPADEYSPVGTYIINGPDEHGNQQTYICIVGYNAATKKVKQLSGTTLTEFKMSGRR